MSKHTPVAEAPKRETRTLSTADIETQPHEPASSLKLRTEGAALLPSLFQGLGEFVQLGLEPLLGLGDQCVGLGVQSLGQASDEILQGERRRRSRIGL